MKNKNANEMRNGIKQIENVQKRKKIFLFNLAKYFPRFSQYIKISTKFSKFFLKLKQQKQLR